MDMPSTRLSLRPLIRSTGRMLNTMDSQDKRRVLVLLPFPPRLDAIHGGARVTAQLIAGLASQHTVAILYRRGFEEQPAEPFFYERCDLVDEIARDWTGRSPGQRLIRNTRLLMSLFKPRPMWVTDWANERFLERVRTVAQQWQPEIVQLDHQVMGQYLPALSAVQAPRVLTIHEPGERMAPFLKGLPLEVARLIHRLDRSTWQRFEPRIIRKVQAVVTFTDQDKKALEVYRTPTPIWKIPFGTTIPEDPLNPLGLPPLCLLFVGNFIHSPNIDAAIRLAHRIFPSLQKHFPELELYIVGDQPPPELKQITNNHIVVTGRVPDLDPYLDRAALFVAPIRKGGGMRVKVLQALAAGKAVVASHLAAEGLDVTDGDQISIADSDQELAERMVQLLANPAERAAQAQRARAWACANLGWEKSIAAYEGLYSNLIAESHCSGGSA